MVANPDDAEGEADDGEGWRFSLEDIEKRTEDEGEEAGDEGGNVAGSFNPADDIEAGDVDLENALFVLVGVALAVAGLAGFVNILP